jgi:hypothetical protein
MSNGRCYTAYQQTRYAGFRHGCGGKSCCRLGHPVGIVSPTCIDDSPLLRDKS